MATTPRDRERAGRYRQSAREGDEWVQCLGYVTPMSHTLPAVGGTASVAGAANAPSA